MGHHITRATLHMSTEEVKTPMNVEERPWIRQHQMDILAPFLL